MKEFIKLPYRYKTSRAFLFYSLIISLTFMFVILNSYLYPHPLIKLGFAIPLTLIALLIIYHGLLLLNKRINWIHYLSFGITIYLVAFGILYACELLSYGIWLAIYMFSLSLFTVSWIINKLVVVIRNSDEHLSVVTFIYILLVACLTFSAGLQHVFNLSTRPYVDMIKEIIVTDIAEMSLSKDIDKVKVDYISYINKEEKLYIVSSFDNNAPILTSYTISGVDDLNGALKYIYATNEMPDYSNVPTFKINDNLLSNIKLPEELIEVKYLSEYTYQDSDNIKHVSAIISAANKNLGKRCEYSLSYTLNDALPTLTLYDGLSNLVIDALLG